MLLRSTRETFHYLKACTRETFATWSVKFSLGFCKGHLFRKLREGSPLYLQWAGEAIRLGFLKPSFQAKFTFDKRGGTWSNLCVTRGDGIGSPSGEYGDLTCILLGFLVAKREVAPGVVGWALEHTGRRGSWAANGLLVDGPGAGRGGVLHLLGRRGVLVTCDFVAAPAPWVPEGHC